MSTVELEDDNFNTGFNEFSDKTIRLGKVSSLVLNPSVHLSRITHLNYRITMVKGALSKARWRTLILCGHNYGVGEYGMECVRNREPERSPVTS